MFGKNIVVKRDPDATYDSKLKVREIFDTIQGEGPFTGVPAVFIRLAGCNLRCHFCDTDFDSDVREMSVEEIIDEVKAQTTKDASRRLIVITGGEPFVQPITKLCASLTQGQNRYEVQIETAGTLFDKGLIPMLLSGKVTLVCSPKTGSVHRDIDTYCKHWKYIVRMGEQSASDGLPMFSTQVPGESLMLYRPKFSELNTIWLQPCEEYGTKTAISVTDPNHIVQEQVPDVQRTKRNMNLAVSIAMRFGYRLSVQTHKILGMR